MSQSQSHRLVRDMAEPPTIDDQVVEYAAEVSTGGTAGVPDTIILVTREGVHARPISGKEAESTLSFSVNLQDIQELECGGLFSQEVSLQTAEGNYTIAAEGLSAMDFTSAIVKHTNLTNKCDRLGMGKARIQVCKWSTCLGCALVLLGVGLSITMIGLLVGIPLIGAGAAVLLLTFAYKQVGEMMGDNVWTSVDSDTTYA